MNDFFLFFLEGGGGGMGGLEFGKMNLACH